MKHLIPLIPLLTLLLAHSIEASNPAPTARNPFQKVAKLASDAQAAVRKQEQNDADLKTVQQRLHDFDQVIFKPTSKIITIGTSRVSTNIFELPSLETFNEWLALLAACKSLVHKNPEAASTMQEIINAYNTLYPCKQTVGAWLRTLLSATSPAEQLTALTRFDEQGSNAIKGPLTDIMKTVTQAEKTINSATLKSKNAFDNAALALIATTLQKLKHATNTLLRDINKIRAVKSR